MNNGNRPPYRILIYGDFLPTGFGRICGAVGKHLNKQGYDVLGACIQYDGILPLPVPMPFHVCGLSGRDQGRAYTGHAEVIANVVRVIRPDIIVSVQDFPYHDALRAAAIDWSVTGHMVITPVDGAPVKDSWIALADQFDELMTISAFGVEQFRQQGAHATLCPPGVDTVEFRRLDDGTRAALRTSLGLPAGAFVVGVMAMNQGRKDFPSMIAAFADAFRDAKDAYLYLDCERYGSWDMRELVTLNHIPPERVKLREDAVKAGLAGLNERYNLLDVHMVIAHREGYGLPHGEAMATGIPSVAMDYCSGPEVIGTNERGWLVPGKPLHPGAFGSWGNAVDYFVELPALVAALREAYEQPAERKARGARALTWAQGRTWEKAGQAVEDAVKRVIAKRGEDMAKKFQQPAPPAPPMQVTPAGVASVPPQIVLNNPVFTVAGHNGHEVITDIAQQVGAMIPLVESNGDVSP
jgi:glycosyltransferase involved in cell wall biosynthesis